MKNRIFLSLLLFLASCSLPKIALEEARVPDLRNFTTLEGEATFSNDGRSVTITTARAVLRYRGREVGQAELREPVKIANGTHAVSYLLDLKEFNLASLITLAPRLTSSPEEFTVDVILRARWGCISRVFTRNDLRLSDLPGLLPQ